jgi:acetylornithine deacetylase/succinyl-diaminopimelate desuccinylase-like protein
MKSAIANYLHVLEELKPSLSNYDLGVMLTTDEEHFGMYGTGMLVEKGYLPQVCILPDSGFGSNWQIENFAKGCWFAQITSLGISAHGSRPWEGSSASIKLVRAVDAITRLFDDRQRPETATLNVGMVRGGGSINQIPAAAMATLDIRFTDMNDYRKLKRWISAICDQYDVNLKTVRPASKPTHNDTEHPLVAAFTRHVATQTGVTPKPFTAYGTTDARFFNDRDIPCVLMSPPGGGHHSSDEWLSIEGYAHYRRILRSYLDEIARTTADSAALLLRKRVIVRGVSI